MSFLLLDFQVNLWTMTGSIVSLAGVAATIFFGSSEQMMNLGEFQLGFGETCVAIAAIINSISTVIGKQQLQSIPLGIFTIYRNILAIS